MDNLTTQCTTTSLTLDQFIARISANSSVTGIVFLGSTATGELSPWSDFDILVVFEELPAPFRLVTTWVDNRFTEVYCTTTQTIAQIVREPNSSAFPVENKALARWLISGKIAYDLTRQLEAAQTALRDGELVFEPTDRAKYDAWRLIGYSVQQMKRYFSAGDSISQLSVDMRLLYSLADVMVSYFTVRGLEWRGEKAAIRFWTNHDPAFFERFQVCLSTVDRTAKVALYEEIASQAVAPFGELWSFGKTAIDLGWGYAGGPSSVSVSSLASAQNTWESLLKETSP